MFSVTDARVLPAGASNKKRCRAGMDTDETLGEERHLQQGKRRKVKADAAPAAAGAASSGTEPAPSNPKVGLLFQQAK